eukprot:CAMPEP_0181235114 /NCGR_PEP_ID=MMETSP1096-20121128/37385_1 /TAXON_ID=156174 ORGANISM="Chrysochromulina ericina, Strain CCMP281" /NCGR_SAMPLE_ID=MMETSP1096 /ASSEMBLY_ACC=CAM_ASM_000453 /LENGTH=172 /DNA_ID=CAMNT_0023330037 /DNA_START=687 /DNA_END=1203 /DNA_ORIENTATION=-
MASPAISKALDTSLILCDSLQTLIDDRQQVVILEGSGDALLVVQLLVHGSLRRVRPWRNGNIDLETRRQRTQQLHTNAEADQCGHRTVWDRRREAHMYVGTLVVNSDKVALGDAQLLKRMRVLRILDLSYQVEDFQVVNGIPFVDVSLSCSLIATPGLVADLEDGGIGVQGR